MPPSSAAAENVVPLPVALPKGPARKARGRNYELEFLPAAVEILESPASPLGRAIALAISLFVAIAILWACVGEIDIVAVAQGRIVPTGRTKVVQAPNLDAGQTGVVKTIAVEEGQHVAQGQLLVELDTTETKANTQRLGHELMRTRLQIARLRAILELPGGEVLDHPPSGTDQATLLLERSLKVAQLAQYQEAIAGLDRELEKQKAAVRATGNEVAMLNQTIPLAMDRLLAKQTLLQKGLAPRMQVLELQQQLIEMQGNRDAAANHVAEGKAGIASTERQKAQAQAQFVQERTKELGDAEAQASALEQELAKAEQRQQLQRLTAPVSGTVQQLALHTVGGMVQPGQQLMVIVPDDTGIEIEAMIQNQDIGFVHEGEEAVIKLDAFPFTRYGTVPGKIKIVSEDAVGGSVDGALSPEAQRAKGEKGEGSSSSNQLFYAARVSLDSTTMNVDGKQVNLAPGMAATVEIKTGKRKLIEFLLSPLMKMTDEAGRER